MDTRVVSVVIAVTLALHGCATPRAPGSASGGTTTASAEGGGTNIDATCWGLGVAAGLACGVLSGGSSGQRVGKAAACVTAVVVGCYVANSYKAEQIRNAKAVEEDYKRANAQLPERATLVAYTTAVDPKGPVTRGQSLVSQSRIQVVPGRSDSKVSVEEELSIVDAQNEVWGKPTRKPSNTNGQAGEFQTTFTVKLPEQMSQGVYEIRKTVYVNGTPSGVNRDSKFQVVLGPTGPVFAMY